MTPRACKCGLPGASAMKKHAGPMTGPPLSSLLVSISGCLSVQKQMLNWAFKSDYFDFVCT